MDRILYSIKKIIPKKIFKIFQPIYHFILSLLAALWYKFPSEKLIVIGVTGTTGKTTVVYLIAKILEANGYKVGYTSTAMFNDGKKEWLNDKKMTMAGRFFIQKMFRAMLRNKCQYAIIETTSEGIVQFRHKFINYDILVFTGLYPEHIDSHGNFENYKKAKGKLFEHLKKCKTKYVDDKKIIHIFDNEIKKINFNRVKKISIVNADDEYANYFLSFWAEKKYEISTKDISIGVKNKKNKLIIANSIDINKKGINFIINGVKINSKLLGKFNITNIMLALSVGISQNIDIKQIKNGLKSINGVPGRFEKIDQGQDFTAIVDYAYESRAVNKLYETIKLIAHNRIIHVLGSAGGGRDVARRFKLGKIAGSQADFVVITNEDPYDDDPQKIIDEVGKGAVKAGKKYNKNLFKILDRRMAIKKALSLARKNDIILITGKGSEQAICIANGEKIKWDDREVVKKELKETVDKL